MSLLLYVSEYVFQNKKMNTILTQIYIFKNGLLQHVYSFKENSFYR